jgi:hypothetical protein
MVYLSPEIIQVANMTKERINVPAPTIKNHLEN